MVPQSLLDQYALFKSGGAFVRLDSSVISITGADRQSFLHNFCTNEIKNLPPNGVCEAFVLNGKGKTIAHVHVLNIGDALLLHGVGGIADGLMEHLDRYIIREDVQMADLSSQRQVAFSIGESSLANNTLSFDADSGTVHAHVEIAGFGCLSIANQDASIEGTEVPWEALDMLRVARRTPWFGRDIDSTNLPQEILRDDKTISFNKGCYLGQETVARIDAMGKVNRVLVSVTMDQELPVEAELSVDDKVIGKLTSVAWSPEDSRWIAMALVRRPHEVPASVLHSDGKKVTVIQ